MAKKVLISCDSTADLSPELVKEFGIEICAQPIIMDDKAYKDMVDVVPEDLYAYAKRTGSLAKTSATNTVAYLEYFNPFLEKEYEIVHFTISSKLSASFNNCRIAASELSGVYAVDSQNLSTGIGLQVLKAARMRDDGFTAAEIAQEMTEFWKYIDTSFVLDTLTYMHKGGRCSSVAALGANLLKLKPCIEVKDGAMDVGKKYRGKQPDVLDEYVSARLANPADIDPYEIFITHSGASPETVERVKAKILEIIPFGRIHETRAGCSVSVHCGPNTLGILFVHKTPIIK